ncbi:MAG: peptidase S41, partial [Melioribacteraceae bacterium]|nr:peptidase S41 [Melioribacteraceae bacterium]
MKRIITCFIVFTIAFQLQAQISAKLMKSMDVSDSQITFVYGGDIWLVSKDGGQALQLTNSPGEESWPRFSPDGTEIAFSASYQGNVDVFVIPSTGGIPTRVTYGSHSDRMVDWHPDGEQLLFASRREIGQRSTNQLFLVGKGGGLPKRLAVPYGELASFSTDGNKLAYITKITENYPFKRYRGGLASDIIIFDLVNNSAENITNNHANDGKPAWAGDKIYFLSDQAEDMRLNIWEYDTKTKNSRQITKFEDFDISYMSAGPSDIVFEAGGVMYLMNLSTLNYKAVSIHVISDLSNEMEKRVDVSQRISNMTASPGAKRIIFEARGELFDVPVKEGYSINMTKSSGAFDRNPSWSPDGKTIAFWSDKSGENEIYFYDVAA